jgi:hypothetical protein
VEEREVVWASSVIARPEQERRGGDMACLSTYLLIACMHGMAVGGSVSFLPAVSFSLSHSLFSAFRKWGRLGRQILRCYAMLYTGLFQTSD